MTVTAIDRRIELRPWEASDWPVAFVWADAAWDMIADDSHPRDVKSFVDIKRLQNSVNVGVWHEGELCGLLTLLPISVIECQGHCIFRRNWLRPDETIEAIRKGIDLAWTWGYERMWLTVFPENRAMIRVLRRMEANYEGRAIARFRHQGQPRDCLNYSFIRP